MEGMLLLGEVLTFLNKNETRVIEHFTDESLMVDSHQIVLSEKFRYVYDMYYNKNIEEAENTKNNEPDNGMLNF